MAGQNSEHWWQRALRLFTYGCTQRTCVPKQKLEGVDECVERKMSGVAKSMARSRSVAWDGQRDMLIAERRQRVQNGLKK